MKILFDQGTPAPLRHELAGHDVSTVFEMGWANLNNGDLLRAAQERFEVLVTTDQNIRHQQNLSGKRLAIVVLETTSWPRIKRQTSKVLEALSSIQPGEVRQVQFPE